LVNWNITKISKADGGLQFRDPQVANLVLGGKILWKIIANKMHWVSQHLRRKYLSGSGPRSLEEGNIPRETPIWNLYKEALPSFLSMLYWILGNGEKICLWEDKIMGKVELNTIAELEGICN